MAYPEGRGKNGAERRRNALLCLIYFAGGENYQLSPKDTYEPLADFFDLSDGERNRTISYRDMRSYWEISIQHSREQLIRKGYLDGSRREIWRLTSEGVDRAAQIERDYDALQNIPSIKSRIRRRLASITSESSEVSRGTTTSPTPREETETYVDVETPEAKDIQEPAEAQRVLYQNYRILRDTKLAREIKSLYEFKCQLCGYTIELRNGTLYAEAHHLKPLGSGGPDVKENIICVCPNHHAQLDYGAIKIDKSALTIDPSHTVSDEYINYHNTVAFESERTIAASNDPTQIA